MEGIAYLHKERVCHRDIKPANIMITDQQEVYIVDFNVAKDFEEAGKDSEGPFEETKEVEQHPLDALIDSEEIGNRRSTNASKKSKLLMGTKGQGTPAFLAPERWRENHNYDEKVDLWSAGIVLIMMLTGDYPFDDSDREKLVK